MASGSNSGFSDCGLPPRPPTASTAVWKHLLRATTTTEAPKSLKDMSIIAPPMAPLDKNATSMRVLLHDTQANFERFSTQVGKLFETIQETKNELKTMQSLFQRDRETMTGDVLDLVNRSQREIQKSIGTPTQSEAFENLCKNINHRLDGLDQRIEAMNAFNQTHSQALQTQMQTVQLILDKQGSMLSAVTPILPFLQGLPPLIEALRTILTDKLRELSTALKDHPLTDTSLISPKMRKRTFVEDGSTPVSPSSGNAIKSPGLSYKRPRVMDLSEAQPSARSILPVTDTGQGTPLLFTSSSSPLLPDLGPTEPFSRTTSNVRLPERQTSTTQNLTTPRRDQNSFAVPQFQPPSGRRLSAADLTTSGVGRGLSSITSPVAPLLSVPAGLFAVPSRTVSTHVTVPTPRRQSNAPNFFGMTPTASRPPRMLRLHTSIAARSRSNSVVSAAESQAPLTSIGNSLKDPGDNKDYLKPPDKPNIPAAMDGGITSKSTTPAIGRITRSSTRASTPLALPRPAQPSPKEGKATGVQDVKNNRLISTLTLPRPPQPSIKENREAVVHDLARLTGPIPTPKRKNIIRPPVPGKLKERRSPLKDGRRFIPLIDSDDDEEN